MIPHNVENRIVTNSVLRQCNSYINHNDLRYYYDRDRSDVLWKKPDCYAKWASCLMMFDDIKRPPSLSYFGVASTMKCVDLGVGDGPVAHIISHEGYDTVGVDLTRVNHPYQSLVVMVLKDAIEFLTDYEDESVDVFLDGCSVTHFNFTDTDNPGWGSVCRAVRRILKPGGYFIASSDIRLIDQHIGEFIMPETIVKTAQESGLTLTSDFDFDRNDAIIRNEGHGDMGVANFRFIKT